MGDLKKARSWGSWQPGCYLLTVCTVLGRLAAVENEPREEREEQQPQSSPETREPAPEGRRRYQDEGRGRYEDSPGSESRAREEGSPEPEPRPEGEAAPPPSDLREGAPARGGRRRYPRDRRSRGRGRERGRDPRGQDRERGPRRLPYQPSAGAHPENRAGAPSDLPQDEQTARKISLLRETREHVDRIREVLLQVLEDLEDVSVQLSKAEHEKDLAEEEIDHLREQLRRLHR